MTVLLALPAFWIVSVMALATLDFFTNTPLRARANSRGYYALLAPLHAALIAVHLFTLGLLALLDSACFALCRLNVGIRIGVEALTDGLFFLSERLGAPRADATFDDDLFYGTEPIGERP
jgi:hypothetical protein